MISQRDARTDAVVEKSRQLRALLQDMADELDRYVGELQAELHKPEEAPHDCT